MEELSVAADGTVTFRDEDGRLHREDGPAATYPDGREIWFIDGVRVPPQ